MHFKGRKVLITGAGGFIGSHLAERLVSMGLIVRAFVHYNSRNYWGWIEKFPKKIKKEIEIVTGDINDPFSVKKAIKGCDICFHLAALIAIPYSYAAPQQFIDTNVKGTLNVLQGCLEEGVGKVIHTSTSEVYGTAQYVPIDEKHPLQGQSPYSASKIGADMIAESYFRSFGLPVSIIRPFNAFGPRQSARAVIPTIITQILTGNVVKLGSMHPTRDLNYVDNTIDGFIRIAESSASVGEVINIGSGQEISIGDLCKRIISLIGKDMEIMSKLERVRPEKSEVDRLVADNSKAKKLIGWEPKVSLNEGLNRTIQWCSKNLSSYKVDIYNI